MLVFLNFKQEASQHVFKHEEDNGGYEVDNVDGFDIISKLENTLTIIMHIYCAMGFEHAQIETMLGASLVTERIYRLELLHNTSLDEGKHFKTLKLELYPELQNALQNGLASEIWTLTEKFIDSIHLYSAKLLVYSGRLKSGLVNAKAIGKLKSFS